MRFSSVEPVIPLNPFSKIGTVILQYSIALQAADDPSLLPEFASVIASPARPAALRLKPVQFVARSGRSQHSSLLVGLEWPASETRDHSNSAMTRQSQTNKKPRKYTRRKMVTSCLV